MATIPGVTDIETDLTNLECHFKVEEGATGIEDKLKSLAETNSHLADFTIKSK